MDRSHLLTLSEPGTGFREGFPLGNGRAGACLMGDPGAERLMLSHIAFFSGESDRDEPSAEAPARFRAAREAALRGDFAGAEEAVKGFMGSRENYGTNLPVGELRIDQALGPVLDYRRTLNLRDGTAEVVFRHDGHRQRRVCFCSHPDNALVLYGKDDVPVALRITVKLAGAGQITCRNGRLVMETRALENLHSDGRCGVCLVGVLAADTAEGTVRVEGNALIIENSREWMLTLRMETDFRLEEDTMPADDFPRAVLPRLTDMTCRLSDYPDLFRRHTGDVSSLMGRAEIALAGDETAAFAARIFRMGQYLTVAAARENSPLPMHLQGVWNDTVACRIAWTCDYHLDVNTQMNYWLCGRIGLAESRMPLFRWMEKRLVPHGRRAAERHYGLPGWTAELVSGPRGYAQPYWNHALAPCPACGAWLALDLMTHVRLTGDTVFLRDRAFPMLEGIVTFFLAYLCPTSSGAMIGGPSISPENAFVPGEDRRRRVSMATTFETCLIRGILTDYLEAREWLGLQEDTTSAKAREASDRLPPIRIAPDGTVAEWSHDWPAEDPWHRHTSHLIGLYPLRLIDPEETPELAAAAMKSLRARVTPEESWEDTGWARDLLILYAARLRDGNLAARHLAAVRSRLTEKSSLIMHPVTRGTGTDEPVWELDGNTGAAVAVTEMLLQSHGDVIHVLPALPDAWREGSFRGLVADGPVTVDASWRSGTVTVGLLSAASRTVTLRCGKSVPERCSLSAGIRTERIISRETEGSP